jgi:hypothetical protein
MMFPGCIVPWRDLTIEAIYSVMVWVIQRIGSGSSCNLRVRESGFPQPQALESSGKERVAVVGHEDVRQVGVEVEGESEIDGFTKFQSIE